MGHAVFFDKQTFYMFTGCYLCYGLILGPTGPVDTGELGSGNANPIPPKPNLPGPI